jgi:hypothetical protein
VEVLLTIWGREQSLLMTLAIIGFWQAITGISLSARIDCGLVGDM